MRQAHFNSLLSAGILFVAAVQTFATETAGHSTNPPVALRRASFNTIKGALPADTVFICTNQTGNTVVLSAPAVEIKSGSKWSTNSGPYLQTLFFAIGSTNKSTNELEPYQSGFCIIRFAPLQFPSPGSPPNPAGLNFIAMPPPTGSVWRIRVQVQNKLTGLSDSAVRLKRMAEEAKNKLEGKGSPTSSKPWSKETSFYDRPIGTVVTDEVTAP